METDALDRVATELQRLDRLLHREILRLRARYQLSLDEFRGLYISDEQVDALVGRARHEADDIRVVERPTRQAQQPRGPRDPRLPTDARWDRLVDEFGLSDIEQMLLVLAVAPELDLKYETIYAYLNNDVTRKWPTCDLAMRVVAASASQRVDVRRALMPDAMLFRCGLLLTVPSPVDRPSWLASGFTAAGAVSHYVMGVSCLDATVASCAELDARSVSWKDVPVAAALKAALRKLPELLPPRAAPGPAPVIVFEGREGAGRSRAAAAICRDLSVPLLRLDIEAVSAAPEPCCKVAQAVMLQQRLHGAGVYVAGGDSLFDKNGNPPPDGERIGRHLSEGRGPVFFACGPGTRWQELFKGRVLHLLFPDPDYSARLQFWKDLVAERPGAFIEGDLEALADRFVLTPGQIRAAVVRAADAHHLSDAAPSSPIDGELLFEAARLQSDQSLGNLAVKVNTIHRWEDLVLPAPTLTRLAEVAAAIRHRHIVYSEWGFERRIATGKGLKALFAGPSGTGKTMTASVIARDLGLDLYKIDLSGIVSKYIGETEKNLDRIFRAAHCSNAVLFFDEADALFGRRSEVRDAHDRYANIEVAYLLQKVEDHEGVVILASNLSRNIDEAFSRRMHYVIEFPVPDERHRERLWRGMFPAEVPLAGDIDFGFLAKQFAIAGGDIRNVVLDAAFLAAQDGRAITMQQLVRAMARQTMKQGRIPSQTEFKQYYALATT